MSPRSTQFVAIATEYFFSGNASPVEEIGYRDGGGGGSGRIDGTWEGCERTSTFDGGYF
jgi:hypothetical protein